MKIGIDIGGSHIGIGLVKEEKIIASKEKILDREARKDMKQTIIGSTKELITSLLREHNLPLEAIELIGIAAPGTISKGSIVKAGNLGLENFAMVPILQEIFKQPIQIRNDGKCAALAEKKYGAMKPYDDCIFINIGTGIGGAAFLGGKLLEPKRYSGFEFGHIVVNKGGRLCSCGKAGCLEAYCSIKSLKNKVTEKLDIDSDISGQYLREELLVPKNEAILKEDVEVFLDYLKTGIGNLIDIFEPEVICFGGSFAYYEGHPLFEGLLKKLQEPNSTFNHGEIPKIVTAKFKNDAGIIGAVID